MSSKNVEWLVVGLGNPGKEYSENRHNIGWMVCTKLAEKYKKPVMAFSRLYLHSALRIKGKLILSILPATFMNNSGKAVKDVCKTFDITTDRIVVISDEYNFPVGKVHIRPGGGDGGHNGIASIIEELGTPDFLRLRCGIGRDFPEGGMPDYVLSDFKPEEIVAKDEMINKAVKSIECLVRLGKGRAMSLINSGSLWKKEDRKEKTENNDDNSDKKNNPD